MKITRALAGLAVGAATALAGLTPAANAAIVHHKHHARTCHVSDWGNTAETGGKWWICQPAGHGRYTWQPLPGRQMAS